MLAINLNPPPIYEQAQAENPFAKHWQKSNGLTIPCQLILKDLNETDDASIPFDAIICEVINWEF